MWNCTNCGEQSEDHFEICWNCQFDRDGIPQLRPEDDSAEARAILEPLLEQNESLSHWAYGIEPMSLEKKLFLFILAALFSIVIPCWVQLLFLFRLIENNRMDGLSPIFTIIVIVGMFYLLYKVLIQLSIKNCIIGLTDRRLFALICKNKFQVEEVQEYRLNDLPIVSTALGNEQSLIEILDWEHPISAKFFRTDQPNNFEHTATITNLLSRVKSKRRSCQQAASYCPTCKAEYILGYTHCNNCDIKLVEYSE